MNWPSVLMLSRHQSLVATSVPVAILVAVLVAGTSVLLRHVLKAAVVATAWCCRDIFLLKRTSRPLGVCSFELFVPDVATSISCRDITSCPCSFQLMVPIVATSISCRDINLSLGNLELVSLDVATSIPCRDFSSCPCSFQLMFSDVATSISYRDIN